MNHFQYFICLSKNKPILTKTQLLYNQLLSEKYMQYILWRSLQLWII